jgi:hypothetical protein
VLSWFVVVVAVVQILPRAISVKSLIDKILPLVFAPIFSGRNNRMRHLVAGPINVQYACMGRTNIAITETQRDQRGFTCICLTGVGEFP